MPRLEAIATAGYVATPPEVVSRVASLVRPGNHGSRVAVRLLDPCAGTGAALRQFAETVGGETYGVELEGDRFEEAVAALDHAVPGSAFSARIQEGAFSGLFLNPPYDVDAGGKRTEHTFLTGVTKYLCPRGLLVYVIPQRRIAGSARYLASHYRDLQCWRFPGDLFDRYQQVVILGTKREEPVSDTATRALVESWASGPLPELPAVGAERPQRTLPVLPQGDVLFTAFTFDVEAAADEAQRAGVWANHALTERLWPPEVRRVRPLMPLRRGHLAVMVTAGFLDNLAIASNGRRFMVRGHTYKEWVSVYSPDPEVEVEREVMRTSVGRLDLDTGVFETLDMGGARDGSTTFAEFLATDGEAIKRAVLDAYPPVCSARNRDEWGFDLTQLRRRPMGAQGDAIRALAVSLRSRQGSNLVGEMGVGKTLIGAAAAWVAGYRRILVLCPPHLVAKWKREVEETIPQARSLIVRSITDLERLPRYSRRPLYVILSRERAKLSYRWQAAVVRRPDDSEGRIVYDERGQVVRRNCCPTCWETVRDLDGVPLEIDELERVKHACQQCGSPLWQADRRGPRRVGLAEYIGRRMPGAFDLLVTDECHEYKARGSAQGIAAATLAEACGRTLTMTGTLLGGYASTLFHILWRFNPEVREEFGYDDEARWTSRYGVTERITRRGEDDLVEDGRSSRRRSFRTRIREKPGVSPAVLFHLLPNTVFVRLSDVAKDLPPYRELVRTIPLDRGDGKGPSQASAYRELADALHAAVMKALQSGSRHLLGAYMQALLTYPDACTAGETVIDPASGQVIASAPALPADRVYPKEREIIARALEERRRGRRVLMYVTHTGKRDITPRLAQLMSDAGLKVAVLKSRTVSPDRREQWVEERVREGVDVLISHPRLVQTGLDLIAFPELAWHEVEYSVYVMRQASRRSWRIGQTQDVSVMYLAYRNTLQAQALALVARKLQASLMVEGEIGDVGLAAHAADGDDLMLELARSLTEGEDVSDESLEALFAEAQRVAADAAEALDAEEVSPEAFLAPATDERPLDSSARQRQLVADLVGADAGQMRLL